MATKIALFVGTLGGGGAERAMLDIARGLAQRGFVVDLVLMRAEGPYLEDVPDCVRVVDLNATARLATLAGLTRYLRRQRPDLLLSTLASANVAALVANILVGRRVAVVVRRASHYSMEYADHGPGGRATLILERALWRVADAVVANSFGAARDLKRIAPGIAPSVRVIHNPVVWPDHRTKAAEPVEHPWFAQQTPVVLAAGRLINLKDHATLLRAFALVAKARPARLIIIGEGEERDNLGTLAHELEIPDLVELPGFRRNPFAWMAKASVFVLSSVYEGSPNVLIQAMACGTPVVSTDCPSGPREILQDGTLGALVPVGDHSAMAEAILAAIDDPIESTRLMSRANDYSAESSIRRYVDVIAEALLAKRKRHPDEPAANLEGTGSPSGRQPQRPTPRSPPLD